MKIDTLIVEIKTQIAKQRKARPLDGGLIEVLEKLADAVAELAKTAHACQDDRRLRAWR